MVGILSDIFTSSRIIDILLSKKDVTESESRARQKPLRASERACFY
jgi:hypothetical protein